MLRSMGNSMIPLIFLAISAIINITLDIVLTIPFKMDVAGAAYATVIAQGISAIALAVYCIRKVPIICFKPKHFQFDMNIEKMIGNTSILTSIQQSVMNLGILMIQGLVNSFGVSVMAAFAAVVKIESFAYLPEQEIGNAFSIFIAQNLCYMGFTGVWENPRCPSSLPSFVSEQEYSYPIHFPQYLQ